MRLDTHIIIFAKAPLAGFAKTRLIPALGEEGAATLAKQLFNHALIEALASQVASVELCVTPSLESQCWAQFDFPEGLALSEQGEGDLGQRMAKASKRALKDHAYVLLMGTDCPNLDRHYLDHAVEELSAHDACLTPVSDGGYALIGLSAFHASLFEGIPWSTDKVASLTLERFRCLDWQVAHLKPLHDIDEQEDLKFLPEVFKADLTL